MICPPWRGNRAAAAAAGGSDDGCVSGEAAAPVMEAVPDAAEHGTEPSSAAAAEMAAPAAAPQATSTAAHTPADAALLPPAEPQPAAALAPSEEAAAATPAAPALDANSLPAALLDGKNEPAPPVAIQHPAARTRASRARTEEPPEPQTAEPDALQRAACSPSGSASPPAGQQLDQGVELTAAEPQVPSDRSAEPAATPPAASPATAAQQADAAAAAAHLHSKAVILADGEIQWTASGSALRQLSLPRMAMQQWRVSRGETPCTMELPGGQSHETQLRTAQSNPGAYVRGWPDVAAELGIQPGDLICMRAQQESQGRQKLPLVLSVRIRQPGDSASPAMRDGAAEAAAAAADDLPAAAAAAGPPAEPAAEAWVLPTAEPEGAAAESQPEQAADGAEPPTDELPSWSTAKRPRSPLRHEQRGRKAAREGPADAGAAAAPRPQQAKGCKRRGAPVAAAPSKRPRRAQVG